ncbi:MAG: VOC family protein [Myxococcales bacterium]|nr:VOC family protein [Myxococcales bacterium]
MAPKRGTRSPIRAQPLIAVADVIASTRWYQHLLQGDELPDSDHAHIYERVMCSGRLVLQLHSWDDEDHPNLESKRIKSGHGVLLWFEVEDFDAAVERAQQLEADVVLEPHENPNAMHREIWLRDPDGYVVVMASPDGETA